MSLSLHEAAALLHDLTPTEAQLFAAAAGALALRHGDLGAGVRQALEQIADDRSKGGGA